MALSAKPLSQNQLTASMVTQYTVPASTVTRLTELFITNTDSVAHTVQICLVPSAGSAGAANAILWNYSVGANGMVPLGINQFLSAGQFIAALASAASFVNLRVSGIEMQ